MVYGCRPCDYSKAMNNHWNNAHPEAGVIMMEMNIERITEQMVRKPSITEATTLVASVLGLKSKRMPVASTGPSKPARKETNGQKDNW